MTDTTNQQIDEAAALAKSILTDAAPLATLGGPAATAGVVLASQAIPALAMVAKMIYAMFHLNHLAALAPANPTPPAA